MQRQINGLEPTFQIRRSRRVKRPQIKFTTTGKLIVSMPASVSEHYAYEFLLDNIDWVKKHYREFKNSQNPLFDSDTPGIIELPCLQQNWQLNYQTLPGAIEVSIKENQGRQQGWGFHAKCRSSIKERLNTWLTEKAKDFLNSAVTQVSHETGLHAARVNIRNQKTRWGSCSVKGNISLNRNLLFLPYANVRYLIIHELCHTVHMNHSSRFWQLVESYEPDFKYLDTQLGQAMKAIPLWARPG